jgi:hypothetical protein
MKIKTAPPEVAEVAQVADVANATTPQAEQAEQPAAEAQQEQRQQQAETPANETPPADSETKPPESETPTAESAASPPSGETLPAAESFAGAAGFAQEVPITWSNQAIQQNAIWIPKPDYVIAHEAEVEELKNEFVLAAQRKSDLENELKAAKKEERDALKHYTQMLTRGPIKPADPKPATATTPGGQSTESPTSASASAPTSPADAVQSDAWRSASINELTDLSEKLRDKLIEAGADTIGTLENLRAQIADGKASWPKGVGAAKITQIEDAVIAWLTRNRDSYAFQSAQQEQQGDEGVSAGDTGESFDTTNNTPNEATEEWIDTEKWGMMPDAEKQAYLLARYRQLRGDDGNAEWAKPAVEGANYFDDGEQEFWATVATGENHTLNTLLANAACPWHPCDAQDDWLRGFGAAYESWLAEKELPDGEGDTGTELDEPEPSAAVVDVAPTPETTSSAPAPAWIDGF